MFGTLQESVAKVYSRCRNSISAIALGSALAFTTPAYAQDQPVEKPTAETHEQPRADPVPECGGRASLQYWGTDRHASGVALQSEAGTRDIRLSLDYAGIPERIEQQGFGLAQLKFHDAYIGAGMDGKRYGGFIAWRTDRTIGDDALALRVRANASLGYGSDSYDDRDQRDRVYATSLGTRVEFSLRPPIDELSFLKLTTGVYAQAFAALPDHVLSDYRNITNSDDKYIYIAKALSLSEGRFGGHVTIDADIFQREDFALRARMREIVDSVHWDIGIAALPYTNVDYLKDVNVNPWKLRSTTRGELLFEYTPREYDLMVGVFAQHVIGSRTFETALSRNGLSGGFSISARRGRVSGRLDAEFYPPSELKDFAKHEPSASFAASIDFEMMRTDSLSAHLGGSVSVNRGRDAFSGLQQTGVGFTAGLTVEFGGSRDRSALYDNDRRSIDYAVAITRNREQARNEQLASERSTAQTTQVSPAVDPSQVVAAIVQDPNSLENLAQVAPPALQSLQRQITDVTDLFDSNPTVEDIKRTVKADPILSALIDVDYVARLYELYKSGGQRALTAEIIRSSDIVIGYGRRNISANLVAQPKGAAVLLPIAGTNLQNLLSDQTVQGLLDGSQTLTDATAKPAIDATLPRGITLSLSPTRNISSIMREQQLERASLYMHGTVYSFRSPNAEAYMRILGHDPEMLDDLIRPRIQFGRR